MKFKLVSWNVRGLNNKEKRNTVKSLISEWRADIICLQETKLAGNIIEITNQILGGRWIRHACLEASGTRGRIILIFESQTQNYNCHITGVYAPNDYMERRLVWEELGSVRGLFEGPWALCGDFNVSRRHGIGGFTTRRCCIYLIPLQRLCLDHIPIALVGGSWERKKSYFKFENWWLQSEGFVDRVKDWWSSFRYSGKPDYVLACKLKALKHKLKEWSKKESGNLGLQRKKLLEQLAEMDMERENIVLTEEEITKKAAVLLEYEDLIKKEEIAWRQRSRILWLKEGDKNTKFFHKMAKSHRRYNNIDQLMIQGEVTHEPAEIEGEIITYYKKLYTEPIPWRPTHQYAICPIITEEEKMALQGRFEENEVLTCLKLCAADKAPGPDGFTMGFFIKCWEIVKQDIMDTFPKFYDQEVFEKSFNATFIALVPKKKGANELRHYRPINLIGSIYKILSKVLIERLKGVIDKLVDSQQMTFIKGRQIIDAVLIANEAVDSRTKQNKPGILCKLDIEKAYDHVNWKYLMKILEMMGFGQKWMNWIMFCISTINFSVLINGLPAGFFSSQRGLRQGDPLSPFLFLITMEGLNSMIKTTNTRGWLKGFDVSRDGAGSLEVTHLQYADDTLIFCGVEEEQLKYLRVILVLFEGVSGLHINWRKSFMYPINEVNNMSYIASILGGVVGTLPTTYLGMPLGAKSKSIEIWNDVIEKCEKKLARWKTQYLSMGGRLPSSTRYLMLYQHT
ncbi:hypothetical protein KY289_027458 [Solanum tuberosum]|nr:hypothetical protein KY289_027458 [Solanum tuberosum]